MDRSPSFISDKELPQQEIDVIEEQETRISEVGESSSANYPEPKRELPEEERNIIEEQLRIYAGEAKKLQEEAYRGSTSCIYRVLPWIKETNGNWFEPDMVCIGPYYYKQRVEIFPMTEECKRKCFGSLLFRTTDQELQINTYMSCLLRINELEEEIRKCYSEKLIVPTTVLLEMMVVDACFIIEIIETFGPRTKFEIRESIEALAWMVPYFYRDFLLLENQIPFFVLEEIYALTHQISIEESRSHLKRAALAFFERGIKRSSFVFGFSTERNIHERDRDPVLHLLDLVWRSLIPFHIGQEQRSISVNGRFFHCISKLRLAGIKVSQPVRARGFLEVKFKKGVIEMPNIAIDDFMRCLFLNCVAFEQCHQRISSQYFSVYAVFLSCLVNTKEDVEYLRERNVIDNYLTDDSKVADFIVRAGKDLLISQNHFYLGKLFEDVDRHYQNRWKWKWASFKREYFDKPWLLLSAAGGILLVLATSFQALMAFLTYKYKNC